MKHMASDQTRRARAMLRSDKTMQALKESYAHKSEPLPVISKDLEEQGRYIADVYDRIGIIVKDDPKVEEELLENYGEVIGILWKSLGRFVQEKWRDKDIPRYASNFERIGLDAIKKEEKFAKQQKEPRREITPPLRDRPNELKVALSSEKTKE